MLTLDNIKNIVALKIDGVKDAIKENVIKNMLVIVNVTFSFNFSLFNMYNTIDENKETCNPDKANRCVTPFVL